MGKALQVTLGHYLMNHHSFTSKQPAHEGFCGGITVCLLRKTTEDLTLTAQTEVLLKLFKTKQQSREDGSTVA